MGILGDLLGIVFNSVADLPETERYYKAGLLMPEEELRKKYKQAYEAYLDWDANNNNPYRAERNGYGRALKERGIDPNSVAR